jgi:hypothetical protein
MRSAFLALITIVLFTGCGKDAEEPIPTYTSPDGIWTYTTPDKSITVEFELTTTDGVLGIQNATIKVSGTSGQAAAQMTNVDLPAIEQIRINANDAVLVLPYAITFDLCAVSSNYSIISAADASYTYPWGQLKTLTGVSITRK